jgi:quercetin dioxygenase-like cupin family protein
MRRYDYVTLPERTLCPGYRGRYIHSDQVTQGWIDIDADAPLPTHSHPNEQWTTLLSGSFELTVNGVPHLMAPGQTIYISPNEPHSARSITACKVLDVFHPVREDYR